MKLLTEEKLMDEDEKKIANVYEDLASDYLEEGKPEWEIWVGFKSKVAELIHLATTANLEESPQKEEALTEISADVLWYLSVISNQRGVTLFKLMKKSLQNEEKRANGDP